MERKQGRKPGKTGKPATPGGVNAAPRNLKAAAARVGEGAASALVSLKRIERDRADAKPGDDGMDDGPAP